MSKKTHLLFLLFAGISFIPSAEAQLTYRDVAPIFYNRCTSCHHNNGGAPFSMMNYSETFPWANSIQTQLQNGTMPPWNPDTAYTRFLDERIITQSEKDAILNWISDGALQGNTSLVPPPPTYPQYRLNGTPDLILQIPTFTSNANTTDSYVCFSLPSNLAEDRILRAYEIVPSNPSIVHHVVVMVDTTGSTSNDLSGLCFYPPGHYGIGGYAPGAPPTVFPGEAPLKAGIRIKAGSKIILQIHYPLGTGGQQDSTQIRMYFYPSGTTGIRQVVIESPLQNWQLYLPPNMVTSATAQSPVPYTVSIFAAFPHSHKVCTSIINYAYSGLDTIPLIRINKWDFNWQGYYTYKKLVKVPAGYTFFSKHVYDNTTNNPNNPHNPPQLVITGVNTTDEMLLDGFEWLEYLPGDENIDIESILANDPLLTTTAIKENSKPSRNAIAYPNPLNDYCEFHFPNEQKATFTFSLYDIAGKSVRKQENLSGNFYIFKPEGLQQGVYIAEITTDGDVFRNRLVVKGE